MHQFPFHKGRDTRRQGISLIVGQILLAGEHGVGREALISQQLGVQSAQALVTRYGQALLPMDAAGIVENNDAADIPRGSLRLDHRLDALHPAFSHPPVPLAQTFVQADDIRGQPILDRFVASGLIGGVFVGLAHHRHIKGGGESGLLQAFQRRGQVDEFRQGRADVVDLGQQLPERLFLDARFPHHVGVSPLSGDLHQTDELHLGQFQAPACFPSRQAFAQGGLPILAAAIHIQ